MEGHLVPFGLRRPSNQLITPPAILRNFRLTNTPAWPPGHLQPVYLARAATVLNMAEQSTEEPAEPATPPRPKDPPSPVDDVVTTRHQLVTPSGTLAYSASAGRVVLREEVQEDGVFRALSLKPRFFWCRTSPTRPGLPLVR